MLVSAQAVQDPVVAKIASLLTAARPQIEADGRVLRQTGSLEPPPPIETYVDPVEAITTMRKHIQSLRTSVLAQAGNSPAATSARDLTAQTLLEIDQSLEKLAEATDSDDPAKATELRDESMRLLSQAASTSVKAGSALGIPWPL